MGTAEGAGVFRSAWLTVRCSYYRGGGLSSLSATETTLKCKVTTAVLESSKKPNTC